MRRLSTGQTLKLHVNCSPGQHKPGTPCPSTAPLFLPCSKAEAAAGLLSSLLPSAGETAVAGVGALAAPAGAALPPLVRFHYIRGLLDWAITAVTKGGSAGGKRGGKAQQKDGPATGEAAAAGGRLQPECWRVIAALLGSDAIPPSYSLPASLLPAATALLAQLPSAPPEQAAALAAHCAALLRVLGGKFGGSHRPSLEHAVGLAEAALSGLQGCGSELAAEWAAASEGALDVLQVRGASCCAWFSSGCICVGCLVVWWWWRFARVWLFARRAA